jgi:hypothetical protein
VTEPLDVKRRVVHDPEIRKVIFDELRAALGAIAGREVYRPLVGERYKVHTPEQVGAWLDEQEQGLIEKEGRRG